MKRKEQAPAEGVAAPEGTPGGEEAAAMAGERALAGDGDAEAPPEAVEGEEPGSRSLQEGGGVGASPAAEAEEQSSPALEEDGLDDLLRQEVVALQEDLDRLRDQHLRLAADFENYRKRVSAELAGSWVRAQAELVRALVDGLDDLQRVSQFTNETAGVDTLIEGVDLVERKLLKALSEAGLEVLNPEGAAFDPNLMEAMMRVPAESAQQDDMVHQVFQKGYRFKDQLVRPARVSVYKDDD